MNRQLLHKLAVEHSGCFHIHIDQKEIMSDTDGQNLLNANFQDVSYSDDMSPSFYHVRDWGNLDVPCIFGIQERDDDENFISAKITWWINNVANQNDDTYETAQEAIDAFFKLFPLSK